MRVSISGLANQEAVVVEAESVLMMAGIGGSESAVTVAHGSKKQLVELSVALLAAVRLKLGDAAFNMIVRAARTHDGSGMEDLRPGPVDA